MANTIWIINQYASTPTTGMGGRHYYLAKGLAALGYRVYLISASYTHLLREPPKVVDAVTVVPENDFNMVWLKMPHYAEAHSKKRILNWFSFAWKLTRLHRVLTDKPDVVLYSSPSLVGYLGAERLARATGARLAFEVRDIWPLTLCEVGGYATNHPFIRFLQWVENRAYRRADVVLSNLKNAYQHMQQHGLDLTKFHWIPNGISLAEATRPEPLTKKVVELLDKSAFKVGYVGTLGVANCLDTLLKTAAELKRVSNVQFVLVGQGREESRLKQLAESLELNNVVFTGAIPKPQVQTVLNEFDVLFIGLTKDELFRFGVSPNKLFDYMYAAKPILYAIDSGDYHPVADIKAGLEMPPEDPQALANAILALQQTSADERLAMGQRAREAVTTQYDYAVLAKKLAEALA